MSGTTIEVLSAEYKSLKLIRWTKKNRRRRLFLGWFVPSLSITVRWRKPGTVWNFGILHIEIFEMLFKLNSTLGVAISLWVGKVPGSNPALILFSPWMAQSGIILWSCWNISLLQIPYSKWKGAYFCLSIYLNLSWVPDINFATVSWHYFLKTVKTT